MLKAALLAVNAATLILALSFAPAQTPQDAESFVRLTYRQYEAKSPAGPDFLGHDAASVFSPSLVGLIRRDERHTPHGEVGKLDGDPICDCQDPDGLKLTAVQITGQTRTSATAEVTLRFPQESSARHIHLRLILLSQGWRIDDIRTPDTPSLRRLLQ
jgi:hypothetical protein